MKVRTKFIPMNKLIVLVVIFSIVGFRHPMHVTVTEVEFDKASRTVEISTHVFLDDLEKHLRLLEKNEELDIIELDEKVRDQLLGTYFINQIGLNINGKDFAPNYLGHQIEGEALWAFLEIPGIRKLKILQIKNNILLDLYDDQANLIHFEYEGEVYSKKLDNATNVAKYELANL